MRTTDAARRPRRVKRLWSIRLHRWTGFALLAWFLFEAVSGSYLAVADDLDPVLHRDRYHHGAGDRGVGAAADAAAGTVADGVAERITYPVDAHGVYEITVKDPDSTETTAYVDPATATVNDTADADSGVFRVILGLHADFNTASILGVGTRQLVGCLGIVWLVNLVLGFFVMRRRRRAVRPSWAFKRGRTRRAFHLALHNWVGLLVLVPAVVAVVTGIALEFPSQASSVMGAALPGTTGEATGAVPYSTPSGDGKRADLDDVDAAVRAADVGAVTYLQVPVGNPAGVFTVIVDGGGYSPTTGGGRPVTVYVDQYSAAPLAIDDPLTDSPAEKAADDWVYGLHFGFFAGWLSKVLWQLIGLGTLVLSVTALYIRAGRYPWQQRRRRAAERHSGLDSAQLELNEGVPDLSADPAGRTTVPDDSTNERTSS